MISTSVGEAFWCTVFSSPIAWPMSWAVRSCAPVKRSGSGSPLISSCHSRVLKETAPSREAPMSDRRVAICASNDDGSFNCSHTRRAEMPSEGERGLHGRHDCSRAPGGEAAPTPPEGR